MVAGPSHYSLDEEDGKEEPGQDTEQLPEDGSADSDEKREMNDWTKILQIEIFFFQRYKKEKFSMHINRVTSEAF
jgi:hypothetical protein